MFFAEKCDKSFVFSCTNKIFALSLPSETKLIGFAKGKRKQNYRSMVHIENPTYAEIAKVAINAILKDERLDEIEVAGIVFLLDAKISKYTTTAYTGIEYMGARETYSHVTYEVSRVALLGAYDSEGEMIATDFAPGKLNLNYTDGYSTIAA